MKTLLFKITPKGTKILKGIVDARIDPLETKAKAVAYVMTLEEYGQLQAMFPRYEAITERYQATVRRTKQHFQCPDILMHLKNIAEKQLELMALQKEYEANNPVYLTPANAVLVEKEIAVIIETAMSKAKYISLAVDDSGCCFSHSVLSGKSVGKAYRKRGSMEWNVIEYPDEALPEDALFDSPDASELEAMEIDRIAALDVAPRANEKALKITAAEDVYVTACARADYLPSTHPSKEKAAAETVLQGAKKKINQLYAD